MCNPTWNSTGDFTFWNGVICADFNVISLILQTTQLYGPVSPSLGNLTYLRTLILGGNGLNGAHLPCLSSCRPACRQQPVPYTNALRWLQGPCLVHPA